MKPTPTPELKARYFGNHIGQDIFHMRPFKGKSDSRFLEGKIIDIVKAGRFLKSYIELRPLSLITDKEAIHIVKLIHIDVPDQYAKDFLRGYFYDLKHGLNTKYNIEVIDYLRSIGIALPFMGYSVEELVELGWCKLKCNHPRNKRTYIGENMLRCEVCNKEFK